MGLLVESYNFFLSVCAGLDTYELHSQNSWVLRSYALMLLLKLVNDWTEVVDALRRFHSRTVDGKKEL